MKSVAYLSIVYPKSLWRAIRAVILSSIQARQVAGRQDIRITGGGQTIQQFLNAGLVDEFTIHYAPLFLGQGVHLFDRIEKEKFSVQIHRRKESDDDLTHSLL